MSDLQLGDAFLIAEEQLPDWYSEVRAKYQGLNREAIGYGLRFEFGQFIRRNFMRSKGMEGGEQKDLIERFVRAGLLEWKDVEGIELLERGEPPSPIRRFLPPEVLQRTPAIDTKESSYYSSPGFVVVQRYALLLYFLGYNLNQMRTPSLFVGGVRLSNDHSFPIQIQGEETPLLFGRFETGDKESLVVRIGQTEADLDPGLSIRLPRDQAVPVTLGERQFELTYVSTWWLGNGVEAKSAKIAYVQMAYFPSQRE